MDHMTQLKMLLWMTTVVLSLERALCSEPLLDVPSTAASSVKQTANLKRYARYQANDSYVGHPLPCTHDEKICLRHSLIFDPKTDRCQPIGGGPRGCYLTANRQEFEHGTGHIVGACQKYEDPCSYGLRYRMAYDGRCYDQNVVADYLCGRESSLSHHFLGGMVCRSNYTGPIRVVQPEEDGLCLVPDFQERDPPAHVYFAHPLRTEDTPRIALNCSSAAQRRCFEQEKVWVEGANGCHSLLKQGPCPLEHVVAIDGRAAAQKRAEATCVHVRGGCPSGRKRMAYDGECHVDRDVALAAPGAVQMNAYGIHEVLNYAESVLYTTGTDGDKCVVEFLSYWPPIEREDRPAPPCGPEDMSQCHLLEIHSTPPAL